ESCLELGENFRPEIVLQRFHVAAIGREYNAAVSGHVELTQSMIGILEVVWHAAFAIDAAAEWNAGEIAFEVVGPLVVRADELLGVAAQLATELGGAMRAAVLEHIDAAVVGARHHHGRGPDIGSDEIARLRHFAFERDIIPGSAVEDPVDLALVNG